MKILFSKYEGTGNDFILIDDRSKIFPADDERLVNHLCDRRFGIGADGLILLQKAPPPPEGGILPTHNAFFRMVYFNSDGKEGSMCGNGGRCFTAFANALGLTGKELNFMASDGLHYASITDEKNKIVKLKMRDVPAMEAFNDHIYLNTGSPHYVIFVKDVMVTDVVNEGRKIRYNDRFKKEGTNVNFVQPFENGIMIRSYERGVEDETLSCGTGATASAIAAFVKGIIPSSASALRQAQGTGSEPVELHAVCRVKVMGGEVNVYFEKNGNGFKDIWLEGPATFVYKGEIEI